MFVNVERTSNALRGEVLYDADCAICSRGTTGRDSFFERRGFHWLPLQEPDAATRLGVSDVELRAEMKLRLADGRVIGGVEAWAVLFRLVWWLWPVGVLIGLPGSVHDARDGSAVIRAEHLDKPDGRCDALYFNCCSRSSSVAVIFTEASTAR